MKLSKNIRILFFGLTLVFSLVSFSGVTKQTPIAVAQTALVISDYGEDTSFSIQYQDVNKEILDSFSKYSNYYFTRFKNVFDLKDSSTFKTYTNKTLSLRKEQLHTKLYSYLKHKTLYNDTV